MIKGATKGAQAVRAFAATGDFLAEEPFCIYEPGTSNKMVREAAAAKR